MHDTVQEKHSWEQKLKEGEIAEEYLDKYFQQWYEIYHANDAQQHNGIDRIFKTPKSGLVWTVEYKADTAAATTGNAFIETMSVAEKNKAGWALTSQAQILVYFIPPNECGTMVSMYEIKKKLPYWLQNFSVRKALNETYHGEGVVIPLIELTRLGKTFRTDKFGWSHESE